MVDNTLQILDTFNTLEINLKIEGIYIYFSSMVFEFIDFDK